MEGDDIYGMWETRNRKFEKRERKSPKPELLLPCPGTEAGMDRNFPETFAFLIFGTRQLPLPSFISFTVRLHWSLFAFVLTEQTLKGYFVKMSPVASMAQGGFSFILFGCTRS